MINHSDMMCPLFLSKDKHGTISEKQAFQVKVMDIFVFEQTLQGYTHTHYGMRTSHHRGHGCCMCNSDCLP